MNETPAERPQGFGQTLTSFPPVFWVANIVEVLERFAYYGIYFGFGIYMASLGFSMEQLGNVQGYFLLVSYGVPLISGTFADKFGFKKVLIVSYLAYLPSILLLLYTKTYSGIVITMLCIGMAAGIFKPLISGTVRAVSDKNNKTLGFGIFYAMVNIGGSFGPIVMGALRAISWDLAFKAAGATIVVMLLVTIFFYKEPERETEGVPLRQKFLDIWTAVSDLKFSFFLILLGVFFWLPFWAFFNLCALYVDANLDTAQLYQLMRGVFGEFLTGFISQDVDGTRRILGETIAHTGWIIMILQVPVSAIITKYRALPAFNAGLFTSAVGFVVIGTAHVSAAWLIFLGIFLFAIGEMISSPRIQEYITWIAPKEKAGLYMGTNFLSVMIGGYLSGKIYTPLYGIFNGEGHPDYVWYALAAHTIVGILVLVAFVKLAGEFTERQE
jgi:dipeptide/tripeptide permease